MSDEEFCQALRDIRAGHYQRSEDFAAEFWEKLLKMYHDDDLQFVFFDLGQEDAALCAPLPSARPGP